MTPDRVTPHVDHTGLRINQATIVLLLVAAFVINAAWLAALVSAVMWWGTVRRHPGFGFVYAGLRRLGWTRPALAAEPPGPHVFAQGLGATVLGLGAGALLLGQPLVGWALAWVVIALAGLNLATGFCAGCAVYYWLGRLGVPAFRRAVPRQER